MCFWRGGQGPLDPVEEALLNASGLNYRERLKAWSIYKNACSVLSLPSPKSVQDPDKVAASLAEDMKWLLEASELIRCKDYAWYVAGTRMECPPSMANAKPCAYAAFPSCVFPP